MAEKKTKKVTRIEDARVAKPSPPKLNVEMGVPTQMPFGSFFGNQREVPRAETLSLDDLIDMRKKDGQARALLRILSLPIRAAAETAEWVEPEEGSAKEETEFANQMFSLPPYEGGMSTPLSKIVRNLLLSLVEGFAVFEQVIYVPDTGPLKGKYVLRKLAHRDSRTVRFMTDDKGGFDGFRQVASFQGKLIDVTIPREYAFYYACHEEENPFYGVSMFESAWHHFDAKRRLYYIAHIAAQMAAVSGRVGKLPPEADSDPVKTDQFRRAISDFGFNLAMTVPQGYEVEFREIRSQFDFMALIDHHNQQMAKSVLAKFLESSDRQVLIENPGQDANVDFFVAGLEALMNEIAESFTHYLMPKFIDWNFGSRKYPVFKFGTLADTQKEALRDLFKQIATAQSSMWTPEFVRETEKRLAEEFGLDIDYDAVEKREAEEQAEAERQQQLMEQQYQGGFAGGGGPGGGGQQGPPEFSARETSGAVVSLADVAREVARLSQEERRGRKE